MMVQEDFDTGNYINYIKTNIKSFIYRKYAIVK